MQRPPRLTSHPLPPYSYVPRMHPHPFSDYLGHSYGTAHDAIDSGDELAIKSVHEWGIDLFNQGYYWEAHEAWESLWHAFGRTGPKADFMKGLIKLAAAGVKAREGKALGVQRHARRARELFLASGNADSDRCDLCLGMSIASLRVHCQTIFTHPESLVDESNCDVMRVFPFVLVLTPPAS